MPREPFLALGGFDERLFVYNEDMAYGRRLREAGLRQRLRTDVLIPHVGGGSGGARTRMFQMRGASMNDYVRDHNPRRPCSASVWPSASARWPARRWRSPAATRVCRPSTARTCAGCARRPGHVVTPQPVTTSGCEQHPTSGAGGG